MGTRLKNQLVTISEMSDMVYFGRNNDTVDNYGGILRTLDIDLFGTRAKVRYVDTNENEQEKQEKYTQHIKVWVRYRSGRTTQDYISWNGISWQVLGIETIDGNRFQVIKCRNIAQ